MSKKIKFYLAIFYLALLNYLVFFLAKRIETDFKGIVNIAPFNKVLLFFKHQNNYKNIHAIPFFIELIGNGLLLMPIPFAIQQIFNRTLSFKKILFTIFLISVFIESTQYLLNVGIADIDDIILNTLGGLIGFLFTSPQKNSLI